MTQEPIQNILEDIVEETPFGATKTAEQDVQFAIDPSFGLTRQRYGWYSNDVLFDTSLVTELEGGIQLETTATGTDSVRVRSAYPGRYIPQTLAEPGLGVRIPEEHVERDSNGLTSLTHGEISVEAVEWDDSTDSGVNALGLSFESDATYVQVRKENNNVEFVPQENWNIDPLDGTGPSGLTLKPENGLVYNFPFTWYGYGAIFFCIQDTRTSKLVPFHKFTKDGGITLGTPNMPIQLTVENQGTADPLSAILGGMQWTIYGSTGVKDSELGRDTKITRRTNSSYIDQNVVIDANNSIDPFAEPGRPLLSFRRDETQLDSRTALSVDVTDTFTNCSGNLYIFVFDEFDAENALTGANFRNPSTVQNPRESNIQADTEATEYTPGSNSVLRSILFVNSDKNTPSVVTGDASTRLPIDAATVFTAALPVGANSVGVQPAMSSVREGY